jgi:hypothetical protein
MQPGKCWHSSTHAPLDVHLAPAGFGLERLYTVVISTVKAASTTVKTALNTRSGFPPQHPFGPSATAVQNQLK